MTHAKKRMTVPAMSGIPMAAVAGPPITLPPASNSVKPLVGANTNFPFGGASILIIVGVGLETVKQIDSQLQQRHYEGLLR